MNISVIIPLYNKGVLIKRAIDSVLSQTYQEFEIVVIDDGSTDESASYVKEYEDVRIKYYYKENGGVSSARNFGVAQAKGDWIVFLDADDEFDPHAFVYFAQLIKEFPKEKVFIGQQEKTRESIDFIQEQTGCPFFMMWLNRFYPRPGAVIIHREVLKQIKGYDIRQSFYEDLEFGLRILTCGGVVYFNKQIIKYNQDGTGLSATFHPVEQEMAYYIPEIVKTQNPGFWYSALLYENLEAEILWWQQHGNEGNVRYYQDMQKKHFGRIHKVLHWVRQKMIRRGMI